MDRVWTLKPDNSLPDMLLEECFNRKPTLPIYKSGEKETDSNEYGI